jgi:hypothetical protein
MRYGNPMPESEPEATIKRLQKEVERLSNLLELATIRIAQMEASRKEPASRGDMASFEG